MENGLREYLKNFLSEERQARLLEVLKFRTKHFTVVLEDLYNPQNAHAIIRTMDSLGIQNLNLIENENMFNYEAVRRVTKGSEKWIDITTYKESNDSSNCLDTLKEQGYFICATTLNQKSVTVDQINFKQKTAFIFGNEHHGISEKVAKKADQLVYIPMYGFSESYNISVSAAIILNQAITELRNSGIDWELSKNDFSIIYDQWLTNAVNRSESLINRYHLEKSKIRR